MSDAMHPSDSLPENSARTHPPSNGMTPAASPPETTDDAWETVNFPGALAVDAIPAEAASSERSGVEAANLFDQDYRPAIADPVQVEQLQQENTQLRSQLAELEADLSQAQIELQLEMARFYCKQTEAEAGVPSADAEAIAPAQTQDWQQELQTAQQALAEHQTQCQAQQLQLAEHQMALAQQQATIDTLTAQLATSQQRVAQLERECALSQQRYSEQLQLVSQAETTCQDLRMRLHRQQQQTLQFKAALEKSIEMNAAIDSYPADAAAIAEAESLPPHAAPPAAPFIPKACPVQPWSTALRIAPQQHSQPKSGTGLPGLLAKFARPPQPIAPDAAEAIPVEVTATPIAPAPPPELPAPPVDAASAHVLEFLFPPQSVPAIANPPVAQAAVFDLSPFIEAGEVDAEQLSALTEAAEPTVPAAQLDESMAAVSDPQPPATTTPAGLWADLARLIEPDLVQTEDTSLPVVAEVIPLQQAAIVPLPESPEPERNTPSPVQETFSSDMPKPLSLVSFVISDPGSPPTPPAEESPVVAQNPFPSFTLHAEETPPNEKVAAPSEPAIAAAPSRHSPSPILYPTRQPKKLPSMAAVELPSFPR